MWEFYILSLFYYAVLIVLSSFAIISLRKRERESWLLYLKLSSCCLVSVNVLCLFLMVPWVGLHFVTVTFPGHTHLHYERVVG